MRLAQAKKIALPLIGALVILVSALMPLGHAKAITQPYLKALGADVMAGGWFQAGNACLSNSQDPTYNPPVGGKQDWYGGIQTYSNRIGDNARGGASSQYAAFSLGQVEGDATPRGFYSSGTSAQQPVSNINKLTFSNDALAGVWGGFFGDVNKSSTQPNCIPDYYSKKTACPAASTFTISVPQPLPTAGIGCFLITNTDISNGWALTPGVIGGNESISADANISIFVEGDLYISRNIVYPSGIKEEDTPKFAVVVQGSIFIDPKVTRLDGLYISQPKDADQASSVASTDGVIWTCHPQSKASIDLTYPATQCKSKLLVNGALISKQIHWIRTLGDVAVAGVGEDGPAQTIDLPSGALRSLNVAEVVNYTPEMVIGGPFFTPVAGTPPKVQSLIYLPPIF